MVTEARIRLAKRLRQLRKKRGLTQEKTAELAGISPRYYVKLEHKRPEQAASVDILERLGKAFGECLLRF